MYISVDARVLQERQYTGVSWYAWHLLSALAASNPHLTLDLHTASARPVVFPEPLPTAWHVHHRHLPSKLVTMASLAKIPGAGHQNHRADLHFMPNWHFTQSSRVPLVVTVHDLSIAVQPEWFSQRRRWWHAAMGYAQLLRRADHIIAVSQHTKRDIVDLLNIPDNRITVVYSAPTPSMPQPLAPQTRLPERYILYIGAMEKRKNIVGLIRAWQQVRQLPHLSDVGLVLVGPMGYLDASTKATIQSGMAGLHYLSYVSPAVKQSILAQATVFCYPSFYEGFGLPILEAAAAGIPVVTSNVTAMPELLGSDCLLVDPSNDREIAMACESLLTNTQWSQQMAQRAYRRAQSFQWERTAAETINVWKKVVGASV